MLDVARAISGRQTSDTMEKVDILLDIAYVAFERCMHILVTAFCLVIYFGIMVLILSKIIVKFAT